MSAKFLAHSHFPIRKKVNMLVWIEPNLKTDYFFFFHKILFSAVFFTYFV